ncbi:MAG: flagellin [Ancalomicrobiaceae bacterium]|nr:flagellin [Ancalomicrobiaceae bacterium]
MPVISTNNAANTAIRYLNANASEQSDALTKLASGSSITKASDDAAGLAISTKLSSDITTLTQAATNASHGVSVLQTADGGASNISDILQRMKSLATQSSSGTVTDSNRTYINAEFQQLTQQVDTIATGTRYNGVSLLDGSSTFDKASGGTSVMVGSSADDAINVSIDSLTSKDLSLTASKDTLASDLTNTLKGGITMGAKTGTIIVNVSDGTNSTAVTLSTTTDTDTNGVLSADEIGAAFTTALTGTGTTVKAAYDSTTGALTLSSTATTKGSSSGISVSLDTSGTDTSITSLSNLGITKTDSTGRDKDTTINVSSQQSSIQAISVLDTAIDQVSSARASIGAQESRFNFTSNSISTTTENLKSSKSAITDVDVASEEAKLSAANVKVQAAVSAVSSADSMTQNLLKLLS